jgi:hypothetical protein
MKLEANIYCRCLGVVCILGKRSRGDLVLQKGTTVYSYAQLRLLYSKLSRVLVALSTLRRKTLFFVLWGPGQPIHSGL